MKNFMYRNDKICISEYRLVGHYSGLSTSYKHDHNDTFTHMYLKDVIYMV